MNIEIHNNGQTNGLSIYLKGSLRPLKNIRANIIGIYEFSDDDILNLLGDSAYNRLVAGEYQFSVTKSILDLVTGNRSAKNRTELQMYP